jgi:glutamyl-tRNA reductase
MTTVAASDIVFTSTGATEPILTKTLLTEVTISANSLMLIDISVPRNVHTDVKELAQVQAFNVDDLKAVVAANQEQRHS